MKKLLAGVIFAVLTLAGVATVALPSASAGAARHTAGVPAHPPADQRVLVGICFQLPTLQKDMGQAVAAYQAHKGLPEAGLWVNSKFYSGNDWAGLDKLVCVVTTVPPPTPGPPIVTTTTAPPVATTLPVTSTTVPVVTTLPSHPEHPCPYDVIECLPHIGPVPCLLPFNDHDRVAAGNYGGEPGFVCEPHHPHPVPPIATTTTVPVVTTLPVTSTTEAPTTTVPVPVTRCIIVRRVQICTLPHETTTTVEQTTTTEAPETTTTAEETTTTEAPTPPTTAPETPCTGLDDCHIVCNDAAGVDDCNICIGNDSCDVIECPIGYTVEANGDCDLAPTPPIATTTTVPVATTLPVTTTTEAPTTTTSTEETTTTAVPTPLSVPCQKWCKAS